MFSAHHLPEPHCRCRQRLWKGCNKKYRIFTSPRPSRALLGFKGDRKLGDYFATGPFTDSRVWIHMYIYMNKYMYVYTYINIYVYIYICIYIYKHTFIQLHPHVHLRIRIRVRLHVQVPAHVHIHVPIHLRASCAWNWAARLSFSHKGARDTYHT